MCAMSFSSLYSLTNLHTVTYQVKKAEVSMTKEGKHWLVGVSKIFSKHTYVTCVFIIKKVKVCVSGYPLTK